MKNSIRTILSNFIIFFIKSCRPFLGTRNVCIHTISCSDYAKYMLRNKSLFIALPLILLRLLSCNPLTAFFLRFKYRNY